MVSKEDTHFLVLRILEKNPNATQRELAKQMGLSLGKTNYLLNALLDKGVIKIENFRRSDSKLKKIAYLLTPAGIAERVRLTQGYMARKQLEYEALKAEIESLQQEQLYETADSNDGQR